MKLGHAIEGLVESITKDGSGVIPRTEGKPFHVYNTIPGESVKATFVKRTPDGMRARLEEIVTASPDRVEPRCPYAGTCGGCKWQHVDGTRQLALKRDLIAQAFARVGVECPIAEVEPCPDPFFYRNRMDFVFGRNGELGLKMPDKWWATLDLETCFLLSPESVQIVNDVRAWAKASGFSFWNGDTHEGFFRYLVIREGKNTGERLVMLVTKPAVNGEDVTSLVDVIGNYATSIVHGINGGLTDLSVADETIPLKGDPWIHEEVNSVRYKITPNAFFQTNTVMAARLQDVVVSYALSPHNHPLPLLKKEGERNGTILDLYCGSGFFSLALAKRFPFLRVVGIELNAEAIVAAKENAATNAVTADYFTSPAEKFSWTTYDPDVVILDPPRAGMHPDVIATLLTHRPPVLVYVSCSVERFTKEWVGTEKHPGLNTAYRITEARALDLFPHTPHMECIFRLERINNTQ